MHRQECTLNLPTSAAVAQLTASKPDGGHSLDDPREWASKIIDYASDATNRKTLGKLENVLKDNYSPGAIAIRKALELRLAHNVQIQAVTWHAQHLTDLEIMRRAWAAPKTSKCDTMAGLRVILPHSKRQLGKLPLLSSWGRKSIPIDVHLEMLNTSTDQQPVPESLTQKILGSNGPPKMLPEDVMNQNPMQIPYDVHSTARHYTSIKPTITDSIPRKLARKESFFGLPILVVEYKKQTSEIGKASGQQLLNLVAAVRFLATLGIVDFPVFGLSTDGPIASLTYAYVNVRIIFLTRYIYH